MKRLLSVMIVMFIVAILIVAVSFGIAFYITKDYKLNTELLNGEANHLGFFDNNNKEVIVNSSNYVQLENISPYLIDAFVTLEDKRFYEHNGLDYKRILASAYNNMLAMSFKEGGSTISQQLIKNTHLNSEKTIKRKLIEMKLTKDLEKNYSKEKILELYLNKIYFGSGLYGIENASMGIFGIPSKDLTLSQSAILAGIVKNPKKNSPLINLQGATERRNIVLNVMLDNGVIDEKLSNRAKNEDIIINKGKLNNNSSAAYFKNVIHEATEVLGCDEKTLSNSGLKIITYFNPIQQNLLKEKLSNNALSPYECEKVSLILNNSNLGVSAYYSTLAIQDATIKRQPGSTFKPLGVFAPAFELNTYSPLTQIIDEPINIDGYCPSNYKNKYYGKVSIRESIANSLNIPAVKVLRDIGIDYAIDFCSKIGITVPSSAQNLSLALGSYELSPMQLAGGYAMFANEGKFSSPKFIEKIYDKNNNLLYEHKKEEKLALSRESAFLISDILKDTAKIGTAKKLKNLAFDVCAKTGTVSNNYGNSDAWCVAYTTKNTVLTWHGGRDNKKENSLPNSATGGSYTAMTVSQILNTIYNDGAPLPFNKPSNISKIDIDADIWQNNGEITRANCNSKNIISDYFSDFNAPQIEQEDLSNNIIIRKNNGAVEIYFKTNSGSRYVLQRKRFLFGGYSDISKFDGDGNYCLLKDYNYFRYSTAHYKLCEINGENLKEYSIEID